MFLELKNTTVQSIASQILYFVTPQLIAFIIYHNNGRCGIAPTRDYTHFKKNSLILFVCTKNFLTIFLSLSNLFPYNRNNRNKPAPGDHESNFKKWVQSCMVGIPICILLILVSFLNLFISVSVCLSIFVFISNCLSIFFLSLNSPLPVSFLF